MHLIAPTDTARTIAQHELRGAVHLGLWPMGCLHPGEKVVANSRPLWPSFTGESEGKDAYTSFEVPEKRYGELDFFGKIIPDMFNKIVTLALEWTKSLKALPTSLSFPPRATIKIPGFNSSFFTQENVSSHKLLYFLYHLSPLIDFKIGTLYIQIPPPHSPPLNCFTGTQVMDSSAAAADESNTSHSQTLETSPGAGSPRMVKSPRMSTQGDLEIQNIHSMKLETPKKKKVKEEQKTGMSSLLCHLCLYASGCFLGISSCSFKSHSSQFSGLTAHKQIVPAPNPPALQATECKDHFICC